MAVKLKCIQCGKSKHYQFLWSKKIGGRFVCSQCEEGK